jgi:1,4-dihydroxy-2-naphthoate octaprenyltransferase
MSGGEFKKLDPVAQWLIATRSAVFLMTFFSVTVGAILAAADHAFSWPKYLLCAFGLILSHATNNLVNDYTDEARGVDKDNYFRTMYGPQVVEMGLWSKQKMRAVIAFTGLLAVLCGYALFLMSGAGVLWLTLIGAFFVLFYTWPIKYIGLGEPTVLLVWGPLMVAGTYLVMTGNWSWQIAAIGAAYAIGPTTVLFGKHTDKLTEDKKKKIHTLPVLLGEPRARAAVIGLLVSQFVFVSLFVAVGWLKFPMLIFLLGIPAAMKAIRVFMKKRPTTKPKDFPAEAWPTYLAGHAFRANRVTGSLFALGLLLSLLVK